MEQITLRELKEATKGTLLGSSPGEEILIGGVQSDNRKIKEGDVFFAFPGERTDGHDYVGAALNAGAAGCVISREPSKLLPGKFYLLVPDTFLALGDLARYYRTRFAIPTVGVTGSVGKTTTKEMIAAVLSRKYRTLKTEGNFNNNIGLPLTILRLTKQDEAAVLEMGMNHFGEISYLTRIARPDMAVITNIGDAHIGNLGSKEGILRAKCEIFEGVPEGGTAVLNADDPYLNRLRDDLALQNKVTLIRVGEAGDADFRAIKIDDSQAEHMSFEICFPDGKKTRVFVPAPGRHMIYPALTAAAVGTCMGLSPEQISEGIRTYTPAGMRMKIEELPGGRILLNDAYNANPQSMEAGLRILSGQKDRRRIAVIGDMGELGSRSRELHRDVGAAAARLGVDVLITVGIDSEEAARKAQEDGVSEVHHCADKEEAKAVLREYLLQPDSAFLVKASRFMQFEELAAFIKDSVI